MCEYIEFNNCDGHQILNQSPSLREMVFDHCTFDSVVCTVRHTTFRNSCHIKELLAGSGFYGAAETLTLQDTTVDVSKPSYHFLNPNEVPSLSFANGVFKVAQSDSGKSHFYEVFVPGHNYIAGFYMGAAQTHNELGPDFKFKCTAVREDTNFIYVDTDSSAATLPPMSFAGGNPCNAYFCVPFFQVTETNYTGQSFANLTKQCEL